VNITKEQVNLQSEDRVANEKKKLSCRRETASQRNSATIFVIEYFAKSLNSAKCCHWV